MLARAFLFTACIVLAGAGAAQEPPPPDVTNSLAVTESALTPGTMVIVPALTPVYVRVDEELSSKIHKAGDRFRIVIAEDVRVNGAIVIRAGSEGEGEVIHAAKSSMGGKPGELLVTARFVRVGDVEVRLRSFSLGAKGLDRSDASMAASVVTGVLGLFVVGGVMIIPRGTVASAKTAIEIQLPALAPADIPRGEEDAEKNT